MAQGFSGQKLKQVRDSRAFEKGITKGVMDVRIAAQVGIAHRNLVRWMNGDAVPTTNNMFKLARACEVDPSYFLDNVEEVDPTKVPS